MTTRPVALDARVCAAPDVLASPFDDEVVLLNLASGVYFGLEGVGARAWSLMQRPATVGEIRDILVGEYDVSSARCTADLQHLVSQLVDRGLAVIEGE